MLDFLQETYGKLIVSGLFLLAIGAALSLWSYVNRDAVTGEFFIWWKLMFVGVVCVVSGFVWRKMS